MMYLRSLMKTEPKVNLVSTLAGLTAPRVGEILITPGKKAPVTLNLSERRYVRPSVRVLTKYASWRRMYLRCGKPHRWKRVATPIYIDSSSTTFVAIKGREARPWPRTRKGGLARTHVLCQCQHLGELPWTLKAAGACGLMHSRCRITTG